MRRSSQRRNVRRVRCFRRHTRSRDCGTDVSHLCLHRTVPLDEPHDRRLKLGLLSRSRCALVRSSCGQLFFNKMREPLRDKRFSRCSL